MGEKLGGKFGRPILGWDGVKRQFSRRVVWREMNLKPRKVAMKMAEKKIRR